MNLGDYLKSKRENASLSQGDVAKKLKYTSPQFISNWERGISLALIRGVRSPKIKLDSIGAIFLSATNLPDSKPR